MARWEASESGFWDDAVRKSSALRAALTRALLDETACDLGFDCSTLFVDMDKFYDHVDLTRLIGKARELGYPLVCLALGMLVHTAERVVKVVGAFGDPLLPDGGVVAGCTQANGYARVVLHEVLAKQAKRCLAMQRG